MLWDSVRKNSEHNVRVILEANFPVDAPLNPLGMTALHFACSHSTKEVINTILSFNPNVNSKDYVSRQYVISFNYDIAYKCHSKAE